MDIPTIITSVCGIIGSSTIISGIVLRRIDKLEKSLDKKEHDRVSENVIRGEVIHTSAKLTEANTLAIRVVTSDEVCETELAALREASDKLEHFIREKSAEYLHAG